MESIDFYPFMKVSLNNEYGVVTDQFVETPPNYGGDKQYGLIRWDSKKESDFEDWRGLFGVFVSQGGHEIAKDHQFKYINDDGSFKGK